MRIVLLLAITILLAGSVLADPSCNPPATGDWNITNTSVLCDNGTAIVVDGGIRLDNATLNVTNGTVLNASSFIEQSASTLRFNESSSTNASITFSFGNITFENATLDGDLLLYQSGATVRFTDSAIHGGVSLNATGSGIVTTLVLENGLYTPTQINVYKGLLNETNATILTGEFSIGALVPPYTAATAVLTDTIINATSFTIGNISTLTTDNLTSNATLVMHENATATLDRSTLNITASDATLTSSSWLVGDLGLNESTVATLTDVNGSITAEDANLTVNGTANDTITVISSTFTLNGEARNVNATASNVTVIGSSTTLFTLTNGSLTATNSALNVTSTNTLLTMTSVNASTLVGTRSSVLTGVIAMSATLSGNNTFSDYTGENLTLAGNGLSSGDLNITSTLFLNENHSLTLNDSSVATLASTGNGTALLDGNLTITGFGAFSQNLTRVYPFTIQNETGSAAGGSDVAVYSLNETKKRVTNWAGDDYDFLWDSDNITDLTIYNSTWNETVELDAQGGGLYNYTNYTLDGVEYNFTVDTGSENLTIVRLSNAASWEKHFTRQDHYRSWLGYADANGYAEPNISVNNITYNDTFLLSSHNQNVTFTFLNDTPMTVRVDADEPWSDLTNYTTLPVIGGDFGFDVSLGNDTVRATYRIYNASSVNWTNGTYNSTQLAALGYNISKTFDGIYLPVGDWNLSVTFYDEYDNNGTVNATFTSEQAIEASVTGASSAETYIGGSDVSFDFSVTTKGAGSVVKAYLTLTAGGLIYNSRYATLSDGDNNTASISGYGNYSGAGNLTLDPIGMSDVPSYVKLNLTEAGTHYQETLTMIIDPYSGLSAGTYTGSYGFGVFG